MPTPSTSFGKKGSKSSASNGHAAMPLPAIDDASVDADVGHRFRQVNETHAAYATLSTVETRRIRIHAGVARVRVRLRQFHNDVRLPSIDAVRASS